MGFFLRLLALVDVIAAIAIIFKFFNIFTAIIAIILLGKGFTSLFCDWTARIYGIIDITATFMIFLHAAPFPMDVIIFLVLIYKGVISLP